MFMKDCFQFTGCLNLAVHNVSYRSDILIVFDCLLTQLPVVVSDCYSSMILTDSVS